MAQSRPPPVRSHSAAVSPPPQSPRLPADKNSDKRHTRRKSGNPVMVSEKRASSSTRPAPLSRKSTSHSIPKVTKTVSSKDREYEGERDSGESFPQFCMTCEKQFVPANNAFLYCSETCRLHDQATTYTSTLNPYPTPNSPPLTPYTRTFSSTPAVYPQDEGPDIIPRLSPTQSRPRSYFNPYPSELSSSYQAAAPPASLPTRHSYSPQTTTSTYTSHSSTALASLRELATALPRTNSRPVTHVSESPPEMLSRTGSGVWNYIPFTQKSSTTTPSATPGNSYTNAGAVSYANGRSREDLYAYGKAMGMDRPLPPRSGPGGYAHRPRSIDLVTPYSGTS